MKKNIFVLIILIAMIISGCLPPPTVDEIPDNLISKGDIHIEKMYGKYTVYEVEGMPCLTVKDDWRSLAISCDWSQWDGNK